MVRDCSLTTTTTPSSKPSTLCFQSTIGIISDNIPPNSSILIIIIIILIILILSIFLTMIRIIRATARYQSIVLLRMFLQHLLAVLPTLLNHKPIYSKSCIRSSIVLPTRDCNPLVRYTNPYIRIGSTLIEWNAKRIG